MKKIGLLFLILIAGCTQTSQSRWPGIDKVGVEIEKISNSIERISYFRKDYHHDSGPFAVSYEMNGKYYNPFENIKIGSSYSKLKEIAGEPFIEWAGGSNEIWFKHRYGAIVIEVEEDKIISIDK